MSPRQHPGRDREASGLVDFGVLAGRIGLAALVLGALAFVGVVVQGVTGGLTFSLMARWAAVFAAAVLAVTVVLVATSALGAADRAQRRGERLSSDDVTLLPPPRRRRDMPGG